MPVPNGLQNIISDSLKNSFKTKKENGQNDNIGETVTSSAKRSLLEKAEIKFVKAERDANSMLQNLKKKYICLNRGAASTDAGDQNTADVKLKDDGIAKPKVVLFPRDKVKLMWEQPRRVGAGLANLGNTCFLNSVLQCLSYTPPLANYFSSNLHKSQCRCGGFCMLCELQQHIGRCLSQSGGSVKPMAILQKLKLIAKHMRWGRQEDAHEFLRYVIDAMQKSCLAGQSNSLEKLSKETTLVHQVFGGYLRSQVRCLQCKTTSNTYDPVLDISVDLKGVNSVEKALQKFVQPEMLDIDNAYKCLRCKKKVRALKQFTIHRAPNILTVHFKRFDYHRLMGGKVTRHIEFSNKLNIRAYMSHKQGEPVNYQLYGVLVHSGFSCNSGHYYCYVKAPNQTWYCMNDSHVSQTGLNSVLNAEAYILFYVLSNSSTLPRKPTLTPSAASSTSSANLSAVKGDIKPRAGPTLLKDPCVSQKVSDSRKSQSTDSATPQSVQSRRVNLTTINKLGTTSSLVTNSSSVDLEGKGKSKVITDTHHSPSSKKTTTLSNGVMEATKKHKLINDDLPIHSPSKKMRTDSKEASLVSKLSSQPVTNHVTSPSPLSNGLTVQVEPEAAIPPTQLRPMSSPIKPKAMSPPTKSKAMSPPTKPKAMSPPVKPKATSPPTKSKAMSPPVKPKAMSPPTKPKAMSPPTKPGTSNPSVKPKTNSKSVTSNGNLDWQVSPSRLRHHSSSESCTSVNSTSDWNVTATCTKSAAASIPDKLGDSVKAKRQSDCVSSNDSADIPLKKRKLHRNNLCGGSVTSCLDTMRINETTPLPSESGATQTAATIQSKKKKKRKKKKKNLMVNGDVAGNFATSESASQINHVETAKTNLNGATENNEKVNGNLLHEDTSLIGSKSHHADGPTKKKKKKKLKKSQNQAEVTDQKAAMVNGDVSKVEAGGILNSCLSVSCMNGQLDVSSGESKSPAVKKKKKLKSKNVLTDRLNITERKIGVNGVDGASDGSSNGNDGDCEKVNIIPSSFVPSKARERMMKKRRYSEPVVKVWDEKVTDDDLALQPKVNRAPSSTWDGRKDSNISFLLERHSSLKGLGSKVLTWEGKKTEMNIETEREMYTPNYKDGWYDGYEQEIDEGKRKKVKLKTAQKHKANQQHFQSIQDNTNVVLQLKKEGKLPSLPSY